MRFHIPTIVRAALASLLLAGVTLAGLAAPASADLESAKQSGEVGERFDGYLGVVSDSAPASLEKMVTKVNAERKTEYEAIAKQNGLSVAQVGALSGKKLIQRAPSGAQIMPTRGRWIKKR